jgi:GAF domain-containing protein
MDTRALLSAISASLDEILPNDCATLDYFDAGTGALTVQFLTSSDGDVPSGTVRLPLEGSPAGAAFRTRKPVLLQRMQDSPFAKEAVRHLTGLGMHSGCWVPLVHAGRAIGTMTVASRLEFAFSQRDADMLLDVAIRAALAVHDALELSQIADLCDPLIDEIPSVQSQKCS